MSASIIAFVFMRSRLSVFLRDSYSWAYLSFLSPLLSKHIATKSCLFRFAKVAS